MLFQTIAKQILTNQDKLLPVRDIRVKVLRLFSGATCYVPVTSASSSNRSYKLLVCKLPGSCWEQAAKYSLCGRSGSHIHILSTGFCDLKDMETAVATQGGKRPCGRKGNALSDSFPDTAVERSIQNHICLHKCRYSASIVNKYTSGAYSQSTE